MVYSYIDDMSSRLAILHMLATGSPEATKVVSSFEQLQLKSILEDTVSGIIFTESWSAGIRHEEYETHAPRITADKAFRESTGTQVDHQS